MSTVTETKHPAIHPDAPIFATSDEDYVQRWRRFEREELAEAMALVRSNVIDAMGIIATPGDDEEDALRVLACATASIDMLARRARDGGVVDMRFTDEEIIAVRRRDVHPISDPAPA